MALTDPNNIFSPDNNHQAGLVVNLRAMAQSVQDEFTRLSGTGVAARDSNVSKPSQAAGTPTPLSNFNVTGETIEAVSNGFRILRSGTFLITGRVTFEPTTSGTVQVIAYVNGGSFHTFVRKNALTEDYTLPVDVSTVNVLDEGDVITLGSSHTSGSAKDETTARLTVTKLG